MGPQSPKTLPKQKSAFPAKAPGFLDRLMSLFAGDDPDRQKQRQLRDIVNELKRSRAKFYNATKGTADAGLARFFWEIYKVVAAAQVLLKGAEVSGALKLALVELSLSDDQIALKERLTEKSIDERAKQGVDPAALDAEVKHDVKGLLEGIDTNWMNEIDATFNRLLVLLDLIGFDYFFLLKKFDPGLPERDFSYTPRFGSIEASTVMEEVQDFLEILPNIDPEADWDRMLAILKEHRGMDVISRDGLKKVLQIIRDVQKSGIMLLMVRHVTQNPAWKPLIRTHREKIVEPYLSKVKAEAETTAAKVASGKRSDKLEELARAVFGTGAVSKLSHYSENSNPEFTQKMLGGFQYVAALNYLRAFLVDYLPKSVREVVDLLIIKGKWANSQASQQMSEAFHQLLKVGETIGRFDTDLGEDGELGRRLKTIALRADRDRKALVQLHMALQQVNDEARTMIGDSVTHFVAIARVLKLAHEDIGKPNPDYLVNWKELKPASDKDLRTVIAAVYKKIYNFVQLMQMYK
jgi:predicted secreted protein